MSFLGRGKFFLGVEKFIENDENKGFFWGGLRWF
jgi:hypothetical protein